MANARRTRPGPISDQRTPTLAAIAATTNAPAGTKPMKPEL
jgi:hypothetical protein